jgi:hypothetical protein
LPDQRTLQLQELSQQLMFKVLCFHIGSDLSHGSSTQTFTVAWQYGHTLGVLFHVEDGCVGLNCFLKEIQWTGNNLSSEMEMPQAFQWKGCRAIKLFVSYANVSKKVKNKGSCAVIDHLLHHVSDLTDVTRGESLPWSVNVHIGKCAITEVGTPILQVARSTKHHPLFLILR